LPRRQHECTTAVELGFAGHGAYLEDRLLEREWLLVDVAAELGADWGTIRRRPQVRSTIDDLLVTGTIYFRHPMGPGPFDDSLIPRKPLAAEDP
jgi:hypothetical protein